MSAPSQIHKISELYEFLNRPDFRELAQEAAPIGVPAGPGALQFDEATWVGLGLVGIWAALDAHIERTQPGFGPCSTCERSNCVPGRLKQAVSNLSAQVDITPFEELEDLRHLFAHNFAGKADAFYWKTKKGQPRPRHVLKEGQPAPLKCSATFDGKEISLHAAALKYYAEAAEKVLEILR